MGTAFPLEITPGSEPQKKVSILHLKVAIFSAFRALFFTVQLHVLHVKSSALVLKNGCAMHTESKRHPHRPHYFTAAPTQPIILLLFIPLHIIGQN